MSLITRSHFQNERYFGILGFDFAIAQPIIKYVPSIAYNPSCVTLNMADSPGSSGHQQAHLDQLDPQALGASAHAITNAGATGARGSYTQADVTRLHDTQGYNRDLTPFTKFQRIPIWSDERWDGTYHGTTHGHVFSVRQISLGDSVAKSRPFIRPQDEGLNPTEYARRFGVLPGQKSRDPFGHSGLTPTDPTFQTSAQSPEDDLLDEARQTIFFEYTSAELAAQGAYNPRLPIAWPPDIDEAVHELFARHRWDQTIPVPMGFWEGVWDTRYGVLLDGTAGTYDALRNQAVWDAIEPALKLASRIIRSNHPYWLAMTSLFHMRPVPNAKDGRTLVQRAQQGGTPYTSVWLEDNDNDPRIPAPYPEMARLKSLGFDSNMSRDICLEILLANVRYAFYSTSTSLAMTSTYEDWHVIIALNSGLVWPLLMNRHLSNSERAAFTFNIASNVLHELAHACALVNRDLTVRAHLIYSTSFGPRITPQIWASLSTLGDQIYGPTQVYPYNTWSDRPLPRQQLFVEDECQGEEGLNFEKQLWGSRVLPHYAYGGYDFTLMPVLTLSMWPIHHPQPLEQGRTEMDTEDRSYHRYLQDPRAPSWYENLAIPVEWYARLFRKSWWQTDFQKFGHYGLKLSTNDPRLPTSLLRTNGQEHATFGNKHDLANVFGAEAWNWLHDTVIATLDRRQCHIISLYLQNLIGQAAHAKIFATKFANEMLSWPNKYDGLVRAARDVANDYQNIVADVYVNLLPGTPAFDATNTVGRIQDINNSILRVLGPMLELSRLMTQDVGYQQNILTHLLQLDPGVRASFGDSLKQLSTMTNRSLSVLRGQHPDVVLQFAHISVEIEGGWVNMLRQKMVADLLGGNAPNTTNGNLPPDIVAEAERFLRLMHELKMLHRTFGAHHDLLAEMNTLTTTATAQGRVPDPAEWPRMQSFSRARRQHRSKVAEPAALRELSETNEPALANLVNEALVLLADKLAPDLLDPTRNALKTVAEMRAQRQRELVKEWDLFLRNEKRMMVWRAKARADGVQGVPFDRMPEELAREMRRMANGVKDDEVFFDSQYTPDIIKDTLAVLTLEFAP